MINLETIVTGFEKIDFDHIQIVNQLNFFATAEDTLQNRLKMVEQFVEYFTTHCSAEEAVMLSSGYNPKAYKIHRAEHLRLKALLSGRINTIIHEFTKEQMMEELGEVLTHHIITYDFDLVKHLKAQQS